MGPFYAYVHKANRMDLPSEEMEENDHRPLSDE
jgi:hypothetical protein